MRVGSPVEVNIESEVILQDLKFRLGNSDLFAGLRYLFIGTTNRFNASEEVLGIPVLDFESDSGWKRISVN